MSHDGPRPPDPSAPPPQGTESEARSIVDPAASRRWTGGDTARVVVAALTLALCWIIAASGVPRFEAATFEAVNAAPGWAYPVAWPVMQLGNVAVVVGLAIVVGIVAGKPRLGFLVALAAAVAWVLAKLVKEQVRRGRPGPEGLDVVLRGPMEDGFGFVSGHSTVAFAAAAVVAPHLRRPWSRVVLGLAVVVGLARVYVGVHLPLDVIGGAACGLLIGELIRAVEVRTRSWSVVRDGAGVGRRADRS